MRNVMVLTEDASQIATRKEHGAGPVISLDAGFFASMGRDCVDFDGGSTDQTDTGSLVAVYVAEARAKVALAQVSVSRGALLGGLYRSKELVAGHVVVEKVLRWDSEVAFEDSRGFWL